MSLRWELHLPRGAPAFTAMEAGGADCAKLIKECGLDLVSPRRFKRRAQSDAWALRYRLRENPDLVVDIPWRQSVRKGECLITGTQLSVITIACGVAMKHRMPGTIITLGRADLKDLPEAALFCQTVLGYGLEYGVNEKRQITKGAPLAPIAEAPIPHSELACPFSREQLQQMYWGESREPAHIARAAGLTDPNCRAATAIDVLDWLDEAGITLRREPSRAGRFLREVQPPAAKQKPGEVRFTCCRPGCGIPFWRHPDTIQADERLFCSTACRVAVRKSEVIAAFPARKARAFAEVNLPKDCRHCGEEFPRSEFALDLKQEDGRSHYCAECARARYVARRHAKGLATRELERTPVGRRALREYRRLMLEYHLTRAAGQFSKAKALRAEAEQWKVLDELARVPKGE